MRNRLQRLLGSFVVLVLLSACSTDTERCDDVNQSRIHQYLSMSYSGKEDRTTASATLRFGDSSGTTLEMVGGCSITNDQITLTTGFLSGFLGTYYDGSKSGLVASQSFTFTDMNGVAYTNAGTITSTAFSSPPTTLSRASLPAIAFADALTTGETMSVNLLNPTQDGATDETDKFVSFSTSTVGGTTVALSAQSLANMANGAKKMYLERTKTSTPTNVTQVGGTLVQKYATPHIDVTLAD